MNDLARLAARWASLLWAWKEVGVPIERFRSLAFVNSRSGPYTWVWVRCSVEGCADQNPSVGHGMLLETGRVTPWNPCPHLTPLTRAPTPEVEALALLAVLERPELAEGGGR